ncbi:hypothetical protein [Paenarthrobacter sp. NPDC089316]|uniref:hypothetical protein n=1 Tax=unclassified Paenarthrobacter TaxID=2634190 RepID=UPI00342B30D3
MDLTVPDSLHRVNNHQVVVPIALMRKGTLRGFDVAYEGKPVTVLEKPTNSNYALKMLVAAVGTQQGLSLEQHASAEHILSQVVKCHPGDEAGALRDFNEWLNGAPADEEFVSLVHALARNFLLMIVLDADVLSKRIVVKYSWDEEPPPLEDKGRKRVSFYHEVADFGFPASQHVEVELPLGLRVRSLELAELLTSGQTSVPNQDIPQHTRNVAHAAISPTNRFARGGFKIWVEPARAGILNFTRGTVVAVVLSVVAAQVLRIFDGFFLKSGVQWIPSPSASIILVGPALLLSWMSKQTEHALLVALLGPLRHCLLLCAGALLLMACLAAIPFSPIAWWLLWFAVMALTGLAVRKYWLFMKSPDDQQTPRA